ncbi:cytochrome c oxidase assembly protein [Mycobacterium sp. CBMA271]|uniref:cytochrome c oxidase assembly protein n=1 Tax=unclassified Mycobacteroides TaxID=2618759 RepID=UPI0012DDA593|nr:MULTISPECIES: cytochrome c oxidase assembly protein [unclassified Mycobacteroides]MUM16898.1 copper resistance protein CopD [Mycobacteroides sp. CBMA 326]MUM24113.1 cytochrome c oxidase assembly protein [Mycobacteroides sp. CBMA 271]
MGVLAPLTPASAVGTWTFDIWSAVLVTGLGAGYCWCYRRNSGPERRLPVVFVAGLLVWLLATMSAVGVYAQVLFWVRALQVLLLMFVVPFLLALGRPITVIRAAVSPDWQARIDRMLCSPVARVAAHPFTTSVGMLATPWLLYLTPWYRATLQDPWIAAGTRILLVLIGFGYFYARLQSDPVPRRYSQMVSLVISIAESLGDGILGLVLWQGPLICADFYLHARTGWGPSLRDDQSFGAGILWIVGDVLSVPFLILLMRAFSVDEKMHSELVDSELDRLDRCSEEHSYPQGEDGHVAASSLWWENEPELRERFGRG